MHRRFHVAATLFVTGSHTGFPCEYALSEALSKRVGDGENNVLANLGYPNVRPDIVCGSLDEALIIAEDVLISFSDPSMLKRDRDAIEPVGNLTMDEERRLAERQVACLCPFSDEITDAIRTLIKMTEREEISGL